MFIESPEQIEADCREAHATGRDIRLHLEDGEVVVARVLWIEPGELAYAALTSSRPERYAVCDSTGTTLAFRAIARARLLEPGRDARARRRDTPRP